MRQPLSLLLRPFRGQIQRIWQLPTPADQSVGDQPPLTQYKLRRGRLWQPQKSLRPQPFVATPGVASLTLTGFAPAVALPINIVPGKASLVLTGFAPAVALPLSVSPGKRSLVLTTFAPAIATPMLVRPGVRALILTGFAPSLAEPIVVRPGVRALTLTSFAPTVTTASGAVNVAPGKAALVLTGFAPGVQGNFFGSAFGHVVSDTGRRQRFPLSIEQPAPVAVMPRTARLKLAGYRPSISHASAVAFSLDELSSLAGELSAEELAVLLAA